MAGATVCVSCAQMPHKNRSLAIKTMRCPDCKAEFGVTSYGSAFRFQPTKRGLLTPAFVASVAIGGALFAFILVLVTIGIWSSEVAPAARRAPEPTPRGHVGFVPEVAIDKKFPPQIDPATGKAQIQALITKIKAENAGQNRDAFVLAQMNRRPELRGMPFIMGTACRLDGNRANLFQTSVQAVREGMEMDSVIRSKNHADDVVPFWTTYQAQSAGQGVNSAPGVAALTQILGPERTGLRRSLVQKLALSTQPEATRAIARAAIFDADGNIRLAAIEALKDRPKEHDFDDILLNGIRYPMPNVAHNAAYAIIELKRDTMLAPLTKFLDEPAPGDPEKRIVENKEVCEVREVVKINHHRNCLLCHPPSATGQPNEVPGVIPIPGSAFPSSPKEAYGAAQSFGEPMVRADTTYLRQDFSLMMPVENAAPWPALQRFDFLVRSRIIDGAELASLLEKVQARPAGFISENHKAALDVLRRLTGQNAAPNANAWQQALVGRDNK
jgi:hypothetical protein